MVGFNSLRPWLVWASAKWVVEIINMTFWRKKTQPPNTCSPKILYIQLHINMYQIPYKITDLKQLHIYVNSKNIIIITRLEDASNNFKYITWVQMTTSKGHEFASLGLTYMSQPYIIILLSTPLWLGQYAHPFEMGPYHYYAYIWY